jgi:Flp pilus assembly protein TadG
VNQLKTFMSWFAADEASEIIELAVSLPLLMVMVVGIYDFGSAFTTKEKIGSAVREGARFASNLPSNDLSSTGATCAAPASVCSIRDLVDENLVTSKLNDCGLSATAASAGPPLSWTFTTAVAGVCPAPLTLTIERGVPYPSATPLVTLPPGSVYKVEASRVTISYPYAWTFNRVITLIASGGNYPGTSQLTEAAVMQNLN